MQSAALRETVMRHPPHPNDLDRKRIERALEQRKRYRYVTPSVAAVTDGYRITAPCCSRNIDPEGGIVDVALILFDADRSLWQLFRKDHDKDAWEHHSIFERLPDLLALLNADEDRQFWQ